MGVVQLKKGMFPTPVPIVVRMIHLLKICVHPKSASSPTECMLGNVMDTRDRVIVSRFRIGLIERRGGFGRIRRLPTWDSKKIGQGVEMNSALNH